MTSLLRKLTIKQRLVAVLLMVTLGTTALSVLSYHNTQALILQEKRQKLEDFTETALNISKHFFSESNAGKLSTEEAKSRALTAIEHLRYQGTEYVWVNGMDHMFIMHPTKPSLNGTNGYNVADPDGVYLIRNAVTIAKSTETGFMRYSWSKPGTNKTVKKLSHVRVYKPWGWVFGSGIYLDDLQHELNALALELTLTGIAIMLALLPGLVLVSQSISKPLATTTHRMQQIASGDGDLTVQLSTEGNDEISSLGHQFNDFTGKIRAIIVDVKGSMENLNEYAQSLNQASHQTASNLSSQQAETDQVASAMHQMSTSAHQIAKNAETASSNAQQAMEESKKCKNTVAKALHIVNELSEDMNGTTQTIDHLKAETENIGSVLTVIRGIAEQTNLLALNAAIEAARAGEQGRGFAVVADEVRALAQKTQQSTEEINNMIVRLQGGANSAVDAMNQSLDKTQATVESSRDAENSLDAVTTAIRSINDMNSQIAVASEEQSQVVEEINMNVSNIAKLAEENRESAEQMLQLSNDLKETSGHVRNSTDRFVI